jgi:hypothetical protein
MDASAQSLEESLKIAKKFTPELEAELKKMIVEFKEGWNS